MADYYKYRSDFDYRYPVGAISEGDGAFVIDASACIECGACTGSCPTGSIELDA